MYSLYNSLFIISKGLCQVLFCFVLFLNCYSSALPAYMLQCVHILAPSGFSSLGKVLVVHSALTTESSCGMNFYLSALKIPS